MVSTHAMLRISTPDWLQAETLLLGAIHLRVFVRSRAVSLDLIRSSAFDFELGLYGTSYLALSYIVYML
jgi:hypothetical protein